MYSVRQLASSNKPHHKLFSEYQKIVKQTSFLPDYTPFKVRYWYFTQQITKPILCKCGCQSILKSPNLYQYVKGHGNIMPEIKEKKKNSIQLKYGSGITNVSQLESVKQKKKETTFKNHGVSCAFDRSYILKHWQEKLGVDNPSELDWVKEKLSKTHKVVQKEISSRKIKSRRKTTYKNLCNNSHFKPLFVEEEYQGGGHFYDFECKKCGEVVHDKLLYISCLRCYNCHPRIDSGGQSLIEKELEDFCRSLSENVISQSRKIISPLELDVYFPDQKTAIELNGLYFHSEKMNKDEFYHLNKTERCEELGIHLIQIFEDEWKEKKEICKSYLKEVLHKKHRLFVSDNCFIKEVSKKIKDKFLNKYHILGTDDSSLCKGLFYKNRLISIMTFKESLRNKNFWILSRFCSTKNFFIEKGYEKLFNSFVLSHQPSEIICYLDQRWFSSNTLKELGFQKKESMSPSYWYVIDDQRKHRFEFQKSFLKEKLKNFNPNLSEVENMNNHGYTRIWDCGQHKFVYEKRT
jgi:hypothetical protein